MLRLARLFVAAVLILTGLYLAIFGDAWGPRVFELLSDSTLGEWLGLIVPFLPMAIIGLGATLFTTSHR